MARVPANPSYNARQGTRAIARHTTDILWFLCVLGIKENTTHGYKVIILYNQRVETTNEEVYLFSLYQGVLLSNHLKHDLLQCTVRSCLSFIKG